MLAAIGNGKIDARVVQHPFGIVVILQGRLAAEQRAVKINILLKIFYR